MPDPEKRCSVADDAGQLAGLLDEVGRQVQAYPHGDVGLHSVSGWAIRSAVLGYLALALDLGDADGTRVEALAARLQAEGLLPGQVEGLVGKYRQVRSKEADLG